MAADTTEGTGLGAAKTSRGPNGGKGTFYANIDVLTKLNDLPQVIVNDDYTLELSDSGKHLYVTGSHNIEIPLSSTVPFKIGTTITLVSSGSDIYFDKENNTTILLYGNEGTANGEDSDNWAFNARCVVTLLKVDQDTWHLFGQGLFID
jgi:hypothetical protein